MPISHRHHHHRRRRRRRRRHHHHHLCEVSMVVLVYAVQPVLGMGGRLTGGMLGAAH